MIKYFYAGSPREVEPEDKLCILKQVKVNDEVVDHEEECWFMDPDDDAGMADLVKRDIIVKRDIPDKEGQAVKNPENDNPGEDASDDELHDEYFATLDNLLEHIVRHLEKMDKKIFELEDKVSGIGEKKDCNDSSTDMIQELLEDFFKEIR